MRTYLLSLAFALLPAMASAQLAPGAFTTVQTTDTSITSLKVGCAVGSASCSGGIKAGPIDVSSITTAGAIGITSSVPGDTSFKLYNDSGTLKWNGTALAAGSSVSGTTNRIARFTSASAIGDSSFEESGGHLLPIADNTHNLGSAAKSVAAAWFDGTITSAAITASGLVTASGGAKVSGGSFAVSGVGGLYFTGNILTFNGGTSGVAFRSSTDASALLTLSDAGALAWGGGSAIGSSGNVALLNATNTFTALGTHAISAGGAGDNRLNIRNTSAGTANRALVSVGNDANDAIVQLIALSSTFTTSGDQVASGGAIRAAGAGGLSVSTLDAAPIRFYTNGTTQRAQITTAGHWALGTGTNITDSAASPSCGTGCSSISRGKDFAFDVVPSSTTSPDVTVNFGVTYANAPVCAITNVGSAVYGPRIISVSTTALRFDTSSTPWGGSSFHVICRGF